MGQSIELVGEVWGGVLSCPKDKVTNILRMYLKTIYSSHQLTLFSPRFNFCIPGSGTAPTIPAGADGYTDGDVDGG